MQRTRTGDLLCGVITEMAPFPIHRKPLISLSFMFFLISECQSLVITGLLHSDVLLPCAVKYKDDFDYNELVVNWQYSENHTVVHSFHYGRSQPKYQDKRYQGRTEIFYDLLPGGNASLLLRNLSKSDAGDYTCYVIIKESSGYITKHVSLVVEDIPESRNDIWFGVISVAVAVAVAVAVCVTIMIIMWKKRGSKKGENTPLLEEDQSSGLIEKYREFIQQKMVSQKDHLLVPRKLRIVDGRTLRTTHGKYKQGFEDKKTISSEQLFTPQSKKMSERMLLVGDSGTGKSCLCRWLLRKWALGGALEYKCIVYLSLRNMKSSKQQVSVKELVEERCGCEAPSSVLNSDPHDVLLILDGIDELHCVEHSHFDSNDDINTPFDLSTLVTKIITKDLLPQTNVLVVSRLDSLRELGKNCPMAFVIQDFTDPETQEYYERITAKSVRSDDIINKIKEMKLSDYTSTPLSILIVYNLLDRSENIHLENQLEKLFTLNEVLIHNLLKSLKEMNGKELDEDKFKQMAKVSYKNLVQREQNTMGVPEDILMDKWGKALYNNDKCGKCNEYQRDILQNMLAAIHCVWEIQAGEDLKECLDFWTCENNHPRNRNNGLIQLIVSEHTARFHNFVKFFMRLLMYPDYNSLLNNQPTLKEHVKEALVEWFKTKMNPEPSSHNLLKLIHYIFELHDDEVRNTVSPSFKNVLLCNTPLSNIDIQALQYCLINSRLDKAELQLCGLRDRGVKTLEGIICNTKYVLISSNNLTKESAELLGDILKDQECAIEKLALGTNELGPSGAQALWRALEQNRSLRTLYLNRNGIGDEGTEGMNESLAKNVTLRELQLCGNSFGEVGEKNIKMLKHSKEELKVVLRITEDEELFSYVEENAQGLSQTWKNYDETWLRNLLEALQKDMEKNDPIRDPITQERVDRLNIQICAVKTDMASVTRPSVTSPSVTRPSVTRPSVTRFKSVCVTCIPPDDEKDCRC
ncbi:protein NLRC3-like isoform X5 [Ascaphus truei]|uniref:protein NLRC3-like isoform X1 n=1 Tax=Ascaphus truei TaxID=8439 RepID=UPI003F5AA038